MVSSTLSIRPNSWLLFGLSLGYFMVLLDTTIVTVALPAIGRDLHGDLGALQWVGGAYTLTFAALLLTAGALADRLGARPLFLGGLWAFGIVSGLSALAGSIGMLIGMRALLGVAGAALLPTSLAIIAAAFPDPVARARALGGWAAITGIALAAGPVLGGALTDLAGWRAIFVINVPIAAAGIALTAKLAPVSARHPARELDVGGQLAAIGALTGLTFGLIQGGSLGWTDPMVIGAFSLAVAAATAFVVIERRGSAPMLPLYLFGDRTFSAGLVAGLLVNFGLSGTMFVLALFFQESRGWAPFVAGVAFLPLTVPTAFNPIFTGRLVARVGPRTPATVGFLLMAVGALAQVPFTAIPGAPAAVNAIGLLLMGFGVSYAIPALVTATVTAMPPEHAGIGSGALNSARQTGAVLGVAVLGTIVGNAGGAGSAISLGIAGGLLLIGAAIVATLT